MSGLRRFWKSYKVLIVMIPGIGLIHWSWYSIKSNPLLNKGIRDKYTTELGTSQALPALPPLPEKKTRE